MDFHIYNAKSDTWIPVEGEIVNIAPHLKGTFAVHQSPLHGGAWTVTHVETGCMVLDTFSGRDDTVEFARSKLATVDQKKLDTAIAKAERIQSPRPERTTAP